MSEATGTASEPPGSPADREPAWRTWLARTLARVDRRYRVPALPSSLTLAHDGPPAVALALAIEQARTALVAGREPGEMAKGLFLDALARLIGDALRTDGGDPAFAAMVLRHRSPRVREHASLSAHAERDRRQLRATANALAHPAKAQRLPPGAVRDALVAVHDAAAAGDWSRLADAADRLNQLQEPREEPRELPDAARRLRDDGALARLRRLDELASDPEVIRYRALWDRQGPSAGSAQAAASGAGAQQRGDAVEGLATDALQALVDRMNAGAISEMDATSTAVDAAVRGDAGDRATYRVVTSLRVPAAFPGDAQRAKSEWDVALLRRHDADTWDLLLLIEAKASADAATTDLPRLLRGLRLLAQADPRATYAFASHQGEIPLRGASLRALPTEEAELARAVLYCSDAPAEQAPRLLSAASRMQLLSAPASLDFADQLERGLAVQPRQLEPVWDQLLTAPAFAPVLRQHATLRTVRELMVHPSDLMAAVRAAPGPT